MENFIVTGQTPLKGTTIVSGSKNVALKALVAACLTEEEVVIQNIPLIADFFVMVEIMKKLGAHISLHDHTAIIQVKKFAHAEVSLEDAAKTRVSAMLLAPLLARKKEAIIPNPGGCRLGARPIDRIVGGINTMSVEVTYHSEDGYFHAKTNGLKATQYTFEKNTHTGTETLILAAVLATGTTVLYNAAEEPEIDELMDLLNKMGAKVQRTGKREITIQGVEKLHGAIFTVLPDRNEIISFAIAALITGGDITIKDAKKAQIDTFLEKVQEIGGGVEIKGNDIRFYKHQELKSCNITTSIYPGFMTDWQAPWAVLMTQANGVSIIHETVFENKMGYIYELKKMGAKVELFNPKVENPHEVYNFNLSDDNPEYFHAVKITGPVKLHNAILKMIDIRAGAAVVLAALAAQGTSTIFGIDKLERGYENFDKRLSQLGAHIKREREK
ncbi:MAG TPA: UDP-N-acetylglucosamine 1-carboxyvinyltransferase [Patescibacteria group bacterium]